MGGDKLAEAMVIKMVIPLKKAWTESQIQCFDNVHNKVESACLRELVLCNVHLREVPL